MSKERQILLRDTSGQEFLPSNRRPISGLRIATISGSLQAVTGTDPGFLVVAEST